MTTPKCVKCGSMSFGSREISPSGSNYKHIAVACVSCGGVVGILDYYNIGAVTQELKKSLEHLTARIEGIYQRVDNIDSILRRGGNR